MIKRAENQLKEYKAEIKKGKNQVNVCNDEEVYYAYGLETVDDLFEIIT